MRPLAEPFWPAAARFESIAPGTQPAVWLAASAAEQFEHSYGFSTFFTGLSPVLAWLCSQPFAGAAFLRRQALLAARAGQRPAVPQRLCNDASDHLNADAWRSGGVPGTVAGP